MWNSLLWQQTGAHKAWFYTISRTCPDPCPWPPLTPHSWTTPPQRKLPFCCSCAWFGPADPPRWLGNFLPARDLVGWTHLLSGYCCPRFLPQLLCLLWSMCLTVTTRDRNCFWGPAAAMPVLIRQRSVPGSTNPVPGTQACIPSSDPLRPGRASPALNCLQALGSLTQSKSSLYVSVLPFSI